MYVHIIVDKEGNIIAEYSSVVEDGMTIGECRDNHYYMNESVDAHLAQGK